MKSPFFLLLCVVLLMSSCKIYTPEFKRYDNLKYQSLGKDGLTLGTDLVFHNPNNFKFGIKGIGLDVFVDGKKMMFINEQRDVTIKRKSEFTIPLSLSIKPDMNIVEGIKELFKIATVNEMDLKIAGNIEVKWLLFKKKLPIDINKRVRIK